MFEYKDNEIWFNGDHYGRLEFNAMQESFVLFPDCLNGDGITYTDSLQETLETIEFELKAHEMAA